MILPNLTLPFTRIIDCTERTRLRQLREGLRHLSAASFPCSFLFQYCHVDAKGAVCIGGLFSFPPEAVTFENAFIRLKHGNGWAFR